MCQNGIGQRASSRSVQPLSGSAYRSTYAALLEHGTITTGARIMPASQRSGCSTSSAVVRHHRRTSSGVSSTRKAQPWLKPAFGARVAWSSARSTTARSTGVSA